MLSLADEKYLEACQPNKHDEWKPPPGAEKYEKNEAAIAKAAMLTGLLIICLKKCAV